MSSTALTVTQNMLPDAAQLTAMLQFSDTLLKSGLLPQHIKSPAAAFAIIQKGIELRIPPMLALSNIIVVQGKPTANAELMAGLIQRDQGDDALRFVAAECNDTKAVLLYKRRGWASPERFTFTIEDAKRANLIKAGPWMQYPGAMLRARAISAVARMAFADSIGGLFTPEELGATVHVTSEGEIVVDTLPEQTNTSTGEITTPPVPKQLTGRAAEMQDVSRVRYPQQEAATAAADGDKPATDHMYKILVDLISQARSLGEPLNDPEPGMTIAQARTLKAFLQDVIDAHVVGPAPELEGVPL